MWWYRDRKDDDGEAGDGPLSPTEAVTAVLGRVLQSRPKEPDRVLAIALLVGGTITLDSGDDVGSLGSSEAESIVDKACGEPQRLYNAYSRDFGEGVPEAHRARLDELMKAIKAVDGVRDCTYGK